MKPYQTRFWGAVAMWKVIVTIVLGASLFGFVVNQAQDAIIKRRSTRLVNNSRQVALAAAGLAFMGGGGHPHISWPGEIMIANGNEPLSTVSDYVHLLIEYGLLSASDVGKMMADPPQSPWDGKGRFDGDKNCSYKIYRVIEADPGSTVLAATRNFVYGRHSDSTVNVRSGEYCVIARKYGDAVIYRIDKPLSPSQIGILPGRKSMKDRPWEGPEDTLIQK